MEIVFSPRAKMRMQNIADYLAKNNVSKHVILQYLNQFENFLTSTLTNFPESGHVATEFGKDIRKIIFKQYCFVYRCKNNKIEILTIYRENTP